MNARFIAGLVFAAFLIVVLVRAKSAIAEDAKPAPSAAPTTQPGGPLDFVVKDIDSNEVNLSQYQGKVVMIVNVASKCGNTPQYAGLEKMYGTYKDRGLVIIGFPANNFGGQEPGDNSQIKAFCTGKYDVTFPMMSKISVKGDDKAPLYHFLTEASTDPIFPGEIKWNFAKFLIGRNGQIAGRFDPKTKPEDPKVVSAVEQALNAQ